MHTKTFVSHMTGHEFKAPIVIAYITPYPDTAVKTGDHFTRHKYCCEVIIMRNGWAGMSVFYKQ